MGDPFEIRKYIPISVITGSATIDFNIKFSIYRSNFFPGHPVYHVQVN